MKLPPYINAFCVQKLIKLQFWPIFSAKFELLLIFAFICWVYAWSCLWFIVSNCFAFVETAFNVMQNANAAKIWAHCENARIKLFIQMKLFALTISTHFFCVSYMLANICFENFLQWMILSCINKKSKFVPDVTGWIQLLQRKK